MYSLLEKNAKFQREIKSYYINHQITLENVNNLKNMIT